MSTDERGRRPVFAGEEHHVRNVVFEIRDLASLYWAEYEATDSNQARALGQAVGELAAELLDLTGVAENGS